MLQCGFFGDPSASSRKRRCDSAIVRFPDASHAALTLTSGNPACVVHCDAMAPTSCPLAAPSAFHRSPLVAFEYARAATYLRMPARNVSGPMYASSMRSTAWPLSYVIAESNDASASSSLTTCCSIGCDDSRASAAIAVSFEPSWRSDHFHDGLRRSVSFAAIHDAKLSLSQMSSHQPIVTRSPFHWCAISCAWMLNTRCLRFNGASAGASSA